MIHDTECIIALANILRENVETLEKVQVLAVSSAFMDFFLHAFNYRVQVAGLKKITLEDTKRAELEIIHAFLALTLKLPLDDFKPLFYRIFNMSYVEADLCSSITVFHVTLEVAKSLKSLFEFICETLVQKASTVLNFYSGNNFEKFTALAQKKQGLQLLLFILEALQTLFTNNRMDSLLTKNYEDLVNAMVALFELKLAVKEQAEEDQLLEKVYSSSQSFCVRSVLFMKIHFLLSFQLSDCLAQLAACTEDETQWKYLNYQVLLNLRSPYPKVIKN